MSLDARRGHAGRRGVRTAPAADLPDGAETQRRRLSGALNHVAGAAAEDQVAALYLRRGARLQAQRWRGGGGEIDMILREGAEIVFVEVKRAATHAEAAERITPRQIARLRAAALAFLAGEPSGQESAMRFDVALVDGAGRIEIIHGADLG